MFTVVALRSRIAIARGMGVFYVLFIFCFLPGFWPYSRHSHQSLSSRMDLSIVTSTIGVTENFQLADPSLKRFFLPLVFFFPFLLGCYSIPT